MEKIIKFHPAYDHKKENGGIHGVDLLFLLKGELGAVQFVLYTHWQLPHIQQEIGDNPLFSKPMPADLGYHSPVPQYDGQETIENSCQWLNGKPCYYDGSGLRANDVYDILLKEGDEGVWKFLEKEYDRLFKDES